MKKAKFNLAGETDRVEYKEAAEQLPQTVFKTISAFANAHGGAIVLGIKQENGKTVKQGVKHPQKLVDDLVSTVGEKFNTCPVINPRVERQGAKSFVVIEVQEALRYEKPIYIKDAGPAKGGYKRVGSADLRLTDKDLQRFYQGRLHSPDAQILPSASRADLDGKTLALFKNLRRALRPDSREAGLSGEGLLKAYGLTPKNSRGLSAAGLLLFGKAAAVRKHFPHFSVDVIRIKGTEWGKDKDPFLSTDLQGNLLNLRSQVVDILERFYLTPFKLGKELARVEEDPFRRALREAVGNLLMHQNYFHASPAQVRLYNDRIEFYNPGCSLKDPATFELPGSELRNALIAPVFYDLGWAETKGTGFKTEIMALRKGGFPEAVWTNDEKNDSFTMVFPYPAEGATPQVTQQVTPQVTQQVTQQVELRDKTAAILKFCAVPRSLKEMMGFLMVKDRNNFVRQIVEPLLEVKGTLLIC